MSAEGRAHFCSFLPNPKSAVPNRTAKSASTASIANVPAAVTAENYLKFVVDPYYRNVLLTTLEVALGATAISLVAGFPTAYFLARTQSRWKSALVMLAILPLLVGNVVRAAGWEAFRTA